MNAQVQSTGLDTRPSRDLSPEAVRMLIRAGRFQGATSGSRRAMFRAIS